MEHTLGRATLAVTAVVLSGLATAVAGQSADPCEPQRLASPPEIPAYKYGFSAATNGRFWFVGDRAARTACGGDPLSCSTGAVHVYERSGDQFVRVQTIVPPDVGVGDNFGKSLDIDGDRLVVGAYTSRWPDGLTANGAVFVYEFDGEEWVEADRIQAPPEVSTGFGSNVVLHADTMIVWPNLGPDFVYAYRLVGGQWLPVQTIRPDPDARNWGFGFAMHLDDQWLFVGAPFDGTITASGGSVYVYARDPGGTFHFVQRLEADFLGRFGHGVGYNGRSLLIGVPGYSPNFDSQGGIFVYEFDGDQWLLVEKLVHSGAEQFDAFGTFLAAQGRVLLGATESERTPEGRGGVYHFEQDAAGTWHEVRRLVASPPEYVLQFGRSMAIDDNRALVASLGEPGGGAAYFFDLTCDPCPPDLDADGTLTIFDFLTFLNLFQDGDPTADFDGDGELTIFDFLAFQTAFDAGCE